MIGTPVCERQEALGHLPSAPTSALPGTSERLAVLSDRARCGESLFHPKDARAAEGSLSTWLARRRLIALLLNDLNA